MGVDLDCYRARIGTFRCRNNTYSKSSDINSENKCGCTQYVADEIMSFYDILNILFALQMEAEINIHDIAQDHLMQSNDVEKNPGPVTDSMCCYDHNLTEKCLRKSQCISYTLMTKSKQITEIDTRVLHDVLAIGMNKSLYGLCEMKTFYFSFFDKQYHVTSKSKVLLSKKSLGVYSFVETENGSYAIFKTDDKYLLFYVTNEQNFSKCSVLTYVKEDDVKEKLYCDNKNDDIYIIDYTFDDRFKGANDSKYKKGVSRNYNKVSPNVNAVVCNFDECIRENRMSIDQEHVNYVLEHDVPIQIDYSNAYDYIIDSIVMASFDQSNYLLFDPYAGNQCVCNSVLALCLLINKVPQISMEDLNDVLIMGNDLYKDIVDKLNIWKLLKFHKKFQ